MININFHPRNLTQKTPQRIWAVLFIEKKRIRIDTNQSILPTDWSKDKKKALSSHPNADKLNKLLKEQKDALEAIVEAELMKLSKEKKRFYKDMFEVNIQEAFDLHFKIGERKPKTEGEVIDFISFIDKYLEGRKDLAEGTHQTLRGTRKNILFAFNMISDKMKREWENMNILQRKLNPDFLQPNRLMEFDEINYNWMQEFNTYLLKKTFKVKFKKNFVERSYSKNYIAKALKNAKQFANAAADAGYVRTLSYRAVKANWEEADTVYLDWEEINKIKALEIDPHSPEGKVRNLFVFNCYLGLRYSDLSRLNKDKFMNIGGQLFIRIRMKKTDEVIKFPIVKSAEDIIKIYDYNFPEICDPTYNEHLKRIAMKAGINNFESKRETRGGKKLIFNIPKYDMISSHTARRSFATNFEADGVPLNELMAITGHTTEKAFRKYVKRRAESEFKGFLAVGANR